MFGGGDGDRATSDETLYGLENMFARFGDIDRISTLEIVFALIGDGLRVINDGDEGRFLGEVGEFNGIRAVEGLILNLLVDVNESRENVDVPESDVVGDEDLPTVLVGEAVLVIRDGEFGLGRLGIDFLMFL